MRLRTLLGAVALGGLSLLPALLGSCGKTPEPPVPLSRWETPYFFTEILEPQTIQLASQTYEEGEPRLGGTKRYLILPIEGVYHSYFRTKERARFEELARKIGDLPSPRVYIHPMPGGRGSLSSGVASISLRAQTAYNSRYPAGAELAPIVRAEYFSYDYHFDKSIAPTVKMPQELSGYTRDLADPLQAMKYLSPWRWPRSSGANSLSLVRLHLMEAPTASPQTFRLTLRLTDGQVFTADLTVDLMKD